jgi:hypothetical protein
MQVEIENREEKTNRKSGREDKIENREWKKK